MISHRNILYFVTAAWPKKVHNPTANKKKMLISLGRLQGGKSFLPWTVNTWPFLDLFLIIPVPNALGRHYNLRDTFLDQSIRCPCLEGHCLYAIVFEWSPDPVNSKSDRTC